MNLKDVLSEFHGASNEPELQQMFRELAPSLLYGGYIQVRDDYEVYIRTVEFYFHSEKADGNKVKCKRLWSFTREEQL